MSEHSPDKSNVTSRSQGIYPPNQANRAAMTDLLALRAAFLRAGHIPAGVRPVVLDSWERCWGYGIDPQVMAPQTADPNRLAAARVENEHLLTNAEPLLKFIHLKAAGETHIVALSDREGYILRLLADGKTANDSATQSANLFEGASWNEREIGCNGIGTCLAVKKPVVLIGPEHFQSAFLNWTCIGVPLQSPRGEILGALDFSVPNALARSETWGWVLAVAREIEANLARGSGEPMRSLPARGDASLSSLTGVIELLVSQLSLPPTHQRFVDDVSRALAAKAAESQQAEDQLRRSHDVFLHLIQNNPFGVCLVDADFRLRQVSLGSQKVFSTVHPLIGRDFAEVLRAIWSEPFASEAIARFRHTLDTGESYSAPSTVERRRDIGEVEAYDWRIERVALPDGRFGVVCYFYDLSERQQWEAAIRQSEARFRELAESLPQLVWTATPDGTVDYYNSRLALYQDFERVPESKSIWHPVLYRDDVAATAGKWRDAVANGHPYQIEHRVRMADGSYRWHLSRAHPSRDANGAILKWFGTATDIDDQKRAQEILEQRVLERTTKLRDTVAELEHFSYTITHDMRAPLRAMQAFGQILREEYGACLDALGRDYLRRITEAANRMDNLITDSLNYSKAVQTHLALDPMNPGPLLRGIVESYPQFQPPQAEIVIAESFPLVLANQAGLTQCFSNLLSNAVKFVKPGTMPKVRVWAEERGSVVRLWIEDNGIGISPDQQERVFVMFQRLSKTYEGTGIGLALVRKVVERMHGKIGFESEPGQGSRFWLELARVERKR